MERRKALGVDDVPWCPARRRLRGAERSLPLEGTLASRRSNVAIWASGAALPAERALSRRLPRRGYAAAHGTPRLAPPLGNVSGDAPR